MRLAIVLTAWAALLPGLARAAEPFRLCVLQYEGALADKASGRGFDLDIGRAIAEQLNRPFEAVWIPNQPTMTEVDDSDLPIKPLLKGKCDAVPSVPGPEAVDADLRPFVTLSQPYYGAGFELVGPPGTSADIRALRGKRVSVQSVTVAHSVAVAMGLDWSARPTTAEQLADLDKKKVDAAIVWGPAMAEFKRAPVAGYRPPEILRWNESIATRAADKDLGKAVDAALAKMRDSGRIPALLKANFIPAHPPFETVFNSGELRMLQLQGAIQPRAAAQPAPAATPIATGAADPTLAPAQPAASTQAATATQPGVPTQAGAEAGPSAAESPAVKFEKDPAAVHRGKLIYTGTCGAYCHPASADSATDAPYLFDCEWKHGGTDQDIFHTITHGVKGTRMVSFAGALSDEDIWKVVAFLRTSTKCEAQKPK